MTLRIGILTMLCLTSAAAVDAATLYRETFGRPDTPVGDLSTVVYDWADHSSNGHWVPNVTTNPTDPTNIVANFGINASNNGRPIDVANVNAGPNSDATTGAYGRGLHFLLAAGLSPTLAWTPEYSVDPANYSNLTFSWYAANANAGDQMKLAVRVGSQWYASNTTFTTAALSLANFTTLAEQKQLVYNPAAANWLTLNFDGTFDPATDTGTDSSVALSTGAAPGSDLSGTITAWGVYFPTALGTRRFDTFQIDGTPVPEPAACALLLIAGMGLIQIRRRS